MNLADQGLWLSIVAGSIRAGTPLVFAGLGELIYERSGVINLGLEGMMLVGAMSAVWAQVAWGFWPLSLFMAVFCGALMGVLHWLLCVRHRTNQIATGVAIVILCHGLTAFLGDHLVGQRIVVDLQCSVPGLSSLPVLGAAIFEQDLLVYLAVLMVVLTWLYLNRTRSGIRLRATGDSAKAAAASGISVLRMRFFAAMACGALCGLGGAHLSLVIASQWQENMVAGRGWIALVMVIFAMWRPFPLLLGAYLFGGLTALHLNLQAAGVRVSSYFLAMLPFVFTILVLVVVSVWLRKRAIGIPADLGKAYDPQEQ